MEIIIISLLSLVFAITIHEFSHAAVADYLGDPTPRSQGRLSLNPLKHLDPIGTIMLFLVHFGWGKPVPIDPYNFRHPKRDEILVSIAGPLSNIFSAIIFGTILHFIPINHFIYNILYSLIEINIILAVFNLLPIPPLDGSKVFLNLLSEQKSLEWQEAFNRYGLFILIIFLFLPIGGSNLISIIISPIINILLSLIIP